MSDKNNGTKENACLVEMHRLYEIYTKYKVITDFHKGHTVDINLALDFTTASVLSIVISEEMRHIAKFHCTCDNGACIDFYNDRICSE